MIVCNMRFCVLIFTFFWKFIPTFALLFGKNPYFCPTFLKNYPYFHPYFLLYLRWDAWGKDVKKSWIADVDVDWTVIFHVSLNRKKKKQKKLDERYAFKAVIC